MMKSSIASLIFAAALAAVAPAAPRMAQDKSTANAPATTGAPAATETQIPEEKLDAAAAAMQQISSLRDSYQQRYDAAPPTDKERIAGEATDALKKVVTDKGLSIDEYSAIITLAQNDPAVRSKILDRIRSQQH
jgi:hypothetical protein